MNTVTMVIGIALGLFALLVLGMIAHVLYLAGYDRGWLAGWDIQQTIWADKQKRHEEALLFEYRRAYAEGEKNSQLTAYQQTYERAYIAAIPVAWPEVGNGEDWADKLAGLARSVAKRAVVDIHGPQPEPKGDEK